MIDAIGTLAAILTTLSFLPQALMVLKTRNTDGISVVMYAMFLTGVAGWFAYGVMISSMPVIVANAVTFVLAALIFAVKVRNVLAVRQASAQGARFATSAPIAA